MCGSCFPGSFVRGCLDSLGVCLLLRSGRGVACVVAMLLLLCRVVRM